MYPFNVEPWTMRFYKPAELKAVFAALTALREQKR